MADRPPAYGEEEGPSLEVGEEELPTHFGQLNLLDSPSAIPDVDSCLAHLRLLAAFHKLKTRIGLHDGLWDIWDSRAGSGPESANITVMLREKRWAIYVARAVDRFEAWWKSFVPDVLRESDMLKESPEGQRRYADFVKAQPVSWAPDMLPPIDVLLVWHAYMLNPRLYLEDCLKQGYGALWASGLPWKLVNAALANDSLLAVSEECREHWALRTHLKWDNLSDSLEKEIPCPVCTKINSIPWTTCGLPSGYSGDQRPGLLGRGYGDGDLSHNCQHCTILITHDALRVNKFRNDAQALVTYGKAMPGTILDLETGMPILLKDDTDGRLFPSRLIKRGLLVEIAEKLKPGTNEEPSMFLVRNMIENITSNWGDSEALKKVENKKGPLHLNVEVPVKGRRHVRKMMSRYWQNSSLAALDLVGAVMRQGVFVEKMFKIDWLHSPASRATMERLIKKYTRFINIIGTEPGNTAVPTLDVDLAWHTHQLSPQSYYEYTVAETKQFVDHDDKIDQDKLSVLFEWTCKVYLEKYGEPYSECTCWYCESIRVYSMPSKSKMFRTSKHEKVVEDWHSSGAAAKVPQPPHSESAHISAHNSIQTQETRGCKRRNRVRRMLFDTKMEESYTKAQKKSTKTLSSKGQPRMGPRGEDVAEFWGKDVSIRSPAASGLFLASTPGMYAVAVASVEAGIGVTGGCASGTCGGSGGCASGALLMCAADCGAALDASNSGIGMGVAYGGGCGGGCGGG